MKNVSIIVPVYNSEKYLKTCIESIQHINMDKEIILVDDASSDHSLDVLRTYEQLLPNEIKVISNGNNKGPGHSRNKGLEKATGEYICFVDSDDYIEPRVYERMYTLAKEKDLDLITMNMNLEYHKVDLSCLSTRKKCSETEKKKLFVNVNPSSCNKMYKSSIAKRFKFPEDTKWEDLPYTLSAVSMSDNFMCLDDIGYHYILNTLGTTSTDTIKLSPRILDIFTSCDILEKNMKECGSYEELKDELRDVQIINSVSRIRDLLFTTMSPSRKKELVNLLSKLIEVKYGDWINNPKYLELKRNSKFYGYRMRLIEALYVDQKQITTDDETVIKEKIKSIIHK